MIWNFMDDPGSPSLPFFSALLGDWRHLLQAIKTHIENSMAPAPIAHTGRTRSSEEEERFSRQLQQEMRRLAASLKTTMTQAGSSMTSRPTGTGSYGSMDEIRDDIDFLQVSQWVAKGPYGTR